jgi:hypothetical protein
MVDWTGVVTALVVIGVVGAAVLMLGFTLLVLGALTHKVSRIDIEGR